MTGSSSRGRDEGGFIVVAVLFVALLYFGLILMIYREQSELIRSVQRYRASVIVKVMAENAAEAAAAGMTETDSATIDETSGDNTLQADYSRIGKSTRFVIDAGARHQGLSPAEAHVRIEGRILPGGIVIDSTRHGRRALE